MIRVAQVIGNICEGGVEACVLNYFKAVDHSEVTFDFFIDKTSKVMDKELIESLGGHVIIVPKYTHLFKYMKVLKQKFSEGNYDIVHANMNTLNIFPLYCAYKAGIKIRIAHNHATTNKKEVIRTIIKSILKPFASCFSTERFACGEYSGKWIYGNKPFTVVNNAIDLDRFQFNAQSRNNIREKYNLNNSFVIGHVGRLVEVKNHNLMFEALAQLLPKHPNTKLFLVGEGPLLDSLKEKVRQLNIEASVIFAGSTADTAPYYHAMDCFILPSFCEGMPVVSVEAQASGVKLIMSDRVTQEAKLVDSTEYISIESPEIWSNRLTKMIETYSFDEKTRGLGFECIQGTKYDIHNEAKKLLDSYKSLVSR